MQTYEFIFTVYTDNNLMETNSNLTDLRTQITAWDQNQAESMLSAQYGGRVRIWIARRIN